MNCIIILPNALERKVIQHFVEEHPGLGLLSAFDVMEDAISFLRENKVDLIIADVQIAGLDESAFKKVISAKTMLIFTGISWNDKTQRYIAPVAFLVRPVIKEAFTKAIEKAVAYHHLLEVAYGIARVDLAGDNFLLVYKAGAHRKILFKDILFIEALNGAVVLRMVDDQIIANLNLEDTFSFLSKSFLRVTQSYIINIQHAVFLEDYIVLINGQNLNVETGIFDTSPSPSFHQANK